MNPCFYRCLIAVTSMAVRLSVCKHNTSNDMFSRCKSVQKMATGKMTINSYSLTTSWNWEQVEIGTKMKLGPKVEKSESDMIAW